MSASGSAASARESGAGARLLDESQFRGPTGAYAKCAAMYEAAASQSAAQSAAIAPGDPDVPDGTPSPPTIELFA